MYNGTIKHTLTVEIEVEIEYNFTPYQPASDYEEGRPLSPPVDEHLELFNVKPIDDLSEMDLEDFISSDDKEIILEQITEPQID